ncbi:MAG: DMT family transporter [Psychrobium sp.]|nr:DMT family transporter [Psychrobium sp.]
MKSTLIDNCTLLLWVSLMASSFVVSEQLIPYVNPIASTALRFLLATILMMPFIGKTSIQRLNYKILFHYSVISLFLVLFFIGLFEALKTTNAMRTSVIYTLLPLISVAITYIGLKLVTPNRQIIGFLIGTLGAIWVLLAFTQENLVLVFEEWRLGDSIFLAACCCLALHVILIKKWATDVPPMLGAFYIMLLGSLILLPFLIFFGDLKNIAWQQITFWQTLLYLTVFTTITTFILQQHLLKKVGPNRLLAFTYLIPSIVVIPQAIANTSQLYSAFPGIMLTLLALYLISPKHQ